MIKPTAMVTKSPWLRKSLNSWINVFFAFGGWVAIRFSVGRGPRFASLEHLRRRRRYGAAMRIGLSPPIPGSGSVDDVVTAARQAADDGFATYWMAQVFGLDALTALTIVGREVSGIELGTAVIPTYPRHPWVMAQQALTTPAVIGNRLALGLGLSHQLVIEGMWGLSYAKPIRHLREYLEVLVPLSKGEAVELEGETVTARGRLEVPGAAPFPILVAALGPQMLALTGQLADGT